jgi:hypothetical protein
MGGDLQTLMGPGLSLAWRAETPEFIYINYAKSVNAVIRVTRAVHLAALSAGTRDRRPEEQSTHAPQSLRALTIIVNTILLVRERN